MVVIILLSSWPGSGEGIPCSVLDAELLQGLRTLHAVELSVPVSERDLVGGDGTARLVLRT